MPSKNVIKEFEPQQYYHVYNRGVEKRAIFLDDKDYTVFIGLIKKYLSGENNNMNNRHASKRLDKDVRLLSYCLMPNHFHLLLYQNSEDGITKFLRRLATGYVMYFNQRYGRVGGLFQGRYKASMINADDYLHHISRYIHLNPRDYKTWPYSSYQYFARTRVAPRWLSEDQVLDLFDNNRYEYVKFLDDYVENHNELESIKWQLANDAED